MGTPTAAPKKWPAGSDLDLRYLRARQEWDDRMGSATVQAKNWRLAALLGYGLNLVCIAGMIYLGVQPKAVPHIVEIDKLGATSYRGPVGQALRDWTPSEASMRYQLRRFVDDTRTVSADPALMKKFWTDAYTLVTENAANMLSTYVEKSDPMKRVETERVNVEVTSVVPVSKETWQVDWRETVWGKSGQQISNSMWRGMLRTVVRPPETEDQLMRNPIGLFIDEFHWDRVQQ